MSNKIRTALFWCWTDDHDEDWFVVARSAREARNFFENYEGYDRGAAVAFRICALPGGRDTHEPDWASEEILKRCGATILRSDEPRVVEIQGVRYEEGKLEAVIKQCHDDMFQIQGQGRPSGTIHPEWN